MGFLPPSDERVHNTVLAIADELTEDGLVLRYEVDSTDTGFAGKVETFTFCSFWLVIALAMIGEEKRARDLCKKLLSFAGSLQLYAEEIDTVRASTWATSRRPSPTWPSSTPSGGSSKQKPEPLLSG
jgi:GH15 family glucan-1,4-alpha-glucosidase